MRRLSKMHRFQCFGVLELALFLTAFQYLTAAQLSVELKVPGPRQYLVQGENATDFLYCFVLNDAPKTVKLYLHSDFDGSYFEVNKHRDPRYNFDPDSTSPQPGNVSYVYSVTSIEPQDGGNYTCQATDENANSASQTIYIPVYDKAKVTEFSALPLSSVNGSTVIVTEKDSVNLYCIVDGIPLPSSTAIKKSSSLKRLAMETVDRVFYNITSVSSKDNGTYECTTSNVVGMAEANIYLNVQYAAQITSFAAKDSKVEDGIVYVIAGADVSLQCISDGNPTPYMTLVHQSIHANRTLIEKRQNTISVQITDVQSVKNDGFYICSASSDINATAYSTILFRVIERPIIVFFGLVRLHDELKSSNSSCKNVSAGERLQLQCVSHGKPDSRVLIFDPDEYAVADASHTASYVFTSGLEKNGTYRCVAQSIFSSNKTFNLCISSSSESADLLPMVIIFSILLCIVLIILVVFVLRWRRQCSMPHPPVHKNSCGSVSPTGPRQAYIGSGPMFDSVPLMNVSQNESQEVPQIEDESDKSRQQTGEETRIRESSM